MTATNATVNELRHWLINEDWYMSQYTRNWLERTPREAAVNVLAGIAEEAQPEPKNVGLKLFTALATIGFMPTAGNQIESRKAGVRAALMLADLNDPRCLAPLLRVFETQEVWQNRYQEAIENALARYLGDAGADQSETRSSVEELRLLATRLWGTGNFERDLPASRANLLISLLHFLNRQDNSTKKNALAEAISKARLSSSSPFRLGVQKFARKLLNSPK